MTARRRALGAVALLGLGALLLLAAPASAQTPTGRWGSVELSVGAYRPDIDSELPASRPWNAIYGGGRGPIFRLDVAKTFDLGFGGLDLGLGAGWFQRTGRGFVQNPDGSIGGRSSDKTVFHAIPTRLSATYRFDVLVERYGIPVAPYARFSLDRWWWWVTNGSGDTSSLEGATGSGATNGYSFSAGLAFLLDFVDRTLAREMDRDTGINHVYLFADVTRGYVDDFGSDRSWDLSNDGWQFAGGLLFVF